MNIKKRDGFKNEKMVILPIESFKAYIEHPMIRSLYLTDMGFFPNAKHHYRERLEGADEAILIYCMDGKGVIKLETGDVKLEKGMAFTIAPSVAHQYYADATNPWSILWLHFKGENLGQFPIFEKEVKPVLLASVEENEMIQKYFMRLFEIAENGHTLGNMICLSQLLMTVISEIYFFERESEMSKVDRNLTGAINYMYDHLYEELTLDDVATYMGLSKSYVNLIFKTHTKRAPLEFFTHLKIQQACKYLRLTPMYIYEISSKLGYEDQYYFSRIFKKVMGISPKNYRKQKVETVVATRTSQMLQVEEPLEK